MGSLALKINKAFVAGLLHFLSLYLTCLEIAFGEKLIKK